MAYSRNKYEKGRLRLILSSCLQEAGELVEAGLGPDHMAELGNLQKPRESNSPFEQNEWLRSGFVIYKSVGVGVMDIAIRQGLLQQARNKGVGLKNESF